MADKEKITDGLNDRPLNDTIAQTGGGIPDDSGSPVEVEPGEVERVRAKLGLKPGQTTQEKVEEATDLPQRGSA